MPIYEYSCPSCGKTFEEFMRSGIALNPEIDLGCHDLLVDFARINLGISCVTREFAAIDGELAAVYAISYPS